MINLNQAKFEDLLDFPCVIDFRIIIDAKRDNALKQLIEFLNEITDNNVQKITKPSRPSSNGNYISYTVPVRVKDADQVKFIYKQVMTLDFVKHIL